MFNPGTSSTSSPPMCGGAAILSGRPASRLNTWWRQAGGFTRRPGDALLFTGLMYQAIPYIEATTRYLARLEGSRWADYLRFGRYHDSRLADGSGVILADLGGGKAEI